MVNLWIDDIRPAPEGFVWCKSVNEAKDIVTKVLSEFRRSYEAGSPNEDLFIDVIDLDHDAGDYQKDGGDYIRFLDWCEWLGGDVINWRFHIHSMNPVGVENMRRIIKRNGWSEIQ